MTKLADASNLAFRKTKLAEKYEHMVLVSNSRPRQRKMIRQAARYRRQAETAKLLAKALTAKAAAKASA
jgi:hypothetical protein